MRHAATAHLRRTAAAGFLGFPSPARAGRVAAAAHRGSRAQDIERFPAAPFARFAREPPLRRFALIGQWRPRVMAVDWDLPRARSRRDLQRRETGRARQLSCGDGGPASAPSALKAGCHAILLKPFTMNLVAARLGRLCREMPVAAASSRLGVVMQTWGTNRTWPDMRCPHCSEAGAVCFEYSSHRRSWYACLGCDHVWLGPRRE